MTYLDNIRDRAAPVVAWYRRNKRWLQLGESVLKTLYYAKESGVPGVIAGSISVGSSVAEMLFPEESMQARIARLGYHPVQTTVGHVLCDLLLQSETPTQEIKDTRCVTKIWGNDGDSVAAIFNEENEHIDGPFVQAGEEDALVRAISRSVWGQGNDLMLAPQPEERGGMRVRLSPIPAPGPFIGAPSPQALFERLQRFGSGPRTILIKGPTGVGKSVLARHIAALASGGCRRTLKVAARVVRGMGSSELRDLTRYLGPSVLLLDDMPCSADEMYSASTLEAILDLLEALRIEGCLVIITMMTGAGSMKSAPRRGDNYVEGLRPGRIDEVICLYAPDAQTRSEILLHYYRELGVRPTQSEHVRLVKETNGLTGAYLAELVRRLAAQGTEHLSQEILSVLRTAPLAPKSHASWQNPNHGVLGTDWKRNLEFNRTHLRFLEKQRDGGVNKEIKATKKAIEHAKKQLERALAEEEKAKKAQEKEIEQLLTLQKEGEA